MKMAKKREMANESQFLMGGTPGKKPVGRPECMCDDNIKTCLEESRQEL